MFIPFFDPRFEFYVTLHYLPSEFPRTLRTRRQSASPRRCWVQLVVDVIISRIQDKSSFSFVTDKFKASRRDGAGR